MRRGLLVSAILMMCASLFAGCNPTREPAATGAQRNAAAPRPASTPKPNMGVASGPLPDQAYKAAISVENPPTLMKAGEQVTIDVKVKNASDVLWPGQGLDGYKFQVKLGNHWLDAAEKTLKNDDGRSDLPRDVKPGEEVLIPLTFTAPSAPGEYILELDLVQEEVTWFEEKGSQTLKLKLKVE